MASVVVFRPYCIYCGGALPLVDPSVRSTKEEWPLGHGLGFCTVGGAEPAGTGSPIDLSRRSAADRFRMLDEGAWSNAPSDSPSEFELLARALAVTDAPDAPAYWAPHAEVQLWWPETSGQDSMRLTLKAGLRPPVSSTVRVAGGEFEDE